jgi:hypothetical protein
MPKTIKVGINRNIFPPIMVATIKKEGSFMPKKGEKPTEKQLAALKANQKPLRKGEQRTKEVASMGGKAVVENGRKEYDRRTFAELIAEKLDLVQPDGRTKRDAIADGLVNMLKSELNKPKPNGKTINALFQAIRDTIGEKPQEKVAVEQEKPFEINITVKQ